jgi:hypothetical protein
MAVSSVGKVAYILKKGNGTTIPDTWYPIAGAMDPTIDVTWTGTQGFTGSVNFQSVLNSKAGINNFANTAARDAAIPTPVEGSTCFIRAANEIQYYSNGIWRVYGDNADLSFKTSNFTLAQVDSGKTIDIDSSTAVVVTIPANSAVAFPIGTQIAFIQIGVGQVSFAPDTGVTLLSKGIGASPTIPGNRKISARYSAATLIKRSENVWTLIGDLTA